MAALRPAPGLADPAELGCQAGRHLFPAAAVCWPPGTVAVPQRRNISPSELVGRFLAERRPFSAICLSAETSSLTAIVNDYGAQEMFARQVEAHGRSGDVLVLLSTSGRSPNLLRGRRARPRPGCPDLGDHRAGTEPVERPVR